MTTKVEIQKYMQSYLRWCSMDSETAQTLVVLVLVDRSRELIGYESSQYSSIYGYLVYRQTLAEQLAELGIWDDIDDLEIAITTAREYGSRYKG